MSSAPYQRRVATTAAVDEPVTAITGDEAAASRTSLVPDTLQEMNQDVELQQHLAALAAAGQQALTREERLQRQRSLDDLGAPSFYTTCQVGG